MVIDTYLLCLAYFPRMCPDPLHPGVGQLRKAQSKNKIGMTSKTNKTLCASETRGTLLNAPQDNFLYIVHPFEFQQRRALQRLCGLLKINEMSHPI